MKKGHIFIFDFSQVKRQLMLIVLSDIGKSRVKIRPHLNRVDFLSLTLPVRPPKMGDGGAESALALPFI